MAWIATVVLAVSALFIPLEQLWPGYLSGVLATAICMVTTLTDRQRQASPNYVFPSGLPVQQHVRIVRLAAFVVCLTHIIMLAQVAAQ